MLSPATIAQFDTPDFRQFLDDYAGVTEKMGYREAQRLRLQAATTASLLGIYHALARLLEGVPQVVGVRPVFNPRLEAHEAYVDVKLQIQSRGGDGEEMNAIYSYGRYPSGFDEPAQELFDAAMDACERINLEDWGETQNTALAQREDPYTHVGQLEQDLAGDVGDFACRVERWWLERSLPRPAPSRPAPRV